jgi:hypothetical protein
MIRKVTFIVLVFLASAFVLLGHGIKVTVEKNSPFIMVKTTYHGGSALANAGVIVGFVFNGEKTEFQKGNTDKNGTFCFYPDKTGTWVVRVDDGLGHKKKTEITLNKDFFNPSPPSLSTSASPSTPGKSLSTEKKIEKKAPPPPITKNEWCCYMLKIVLGVVLILGITFMLHRLTKRQETSNKK